MSGVLRLSACCLSALAVAACASSGAAAPEQHRGATPVNSTAQGHAEFQRRLKEYVALHEKLERTLPDLPKEATPQQIDTHQRSLTRLLQDARRGAQPGDLFVPPVRSEIRRVMARVFRGPEGRALLSSTMDENPVALKVKVNDPYPDSVPLSTVPPQVLQALPELPKDMEFRFVGRALVLLDVHAHMIVDIVEKAIDT